MSEGPLTIRQVGEAGWGEHWLGPMGTAISVGDRTMRHWSGDNGAPEIPLGLEDELIDVLEERKREIDRVIKILGESGLDRTPVVTGGFQTTVYPNMRKPGERRKR